jgi:hypothetical protein
MYYPFGKYTWGEYTLGGVHPFSPPSQTTYTVRLVNFVRSEKINGDFRKLNGGYLKINGVT